MASDLNPGDIFQFYLVTEVDQAYVLEANDSRITTTTTDFHTANNVDAHNTLIVGEVDLWITKESELVEQTFVKRESSGVMTYTITVTNGGPSDAAQVHVVDYLPDGLVLDPAYIQVSVSAGSIIDVTDDGLVTVIVGNDSNFDSNPELGRMNIGITEVDTNSGPIQADNVVVTD